MRTAMVCGALVALTVTAAGAAQDPRFSANHFFPDCKAFAEEPDRPLNFGMGRCTGIIEGLVYLLDDVSASPFCVAFPATVSTSQAARVVVRYIEARPQRMHESFARLAMEALHDAWPCRN